MIAAGAHVAVSLLDSHLTHPIVSQQWLIHAASDMSLPLTRTPMFLPELTHHSSLLAMQGSPCPASGFCGVPECGEWSEGSESRGVACNAAAYTPPPVINASAAAPAGSVAAGPGSAGPAATPLGAWFFDAEAPGPGGPDVGVAIGGDAPASIGEPLESGPPVVGTPALDEDNSPALVGAAGEGGDYDDVSRELPLTADSQTAAAGHDAWRRRRLPSVLVAAGTVAAVLLR